MTVPPGVGALPPDHCVVCVVAHCELLCGGPLSAYQLFWYLLLENKIKLPACRAHLYDSSCILETKVTFPVLRVSQVKTTNPGPWQSRDAVSMAKPIPPSELPIITGRKLYGRECEQP